MPSYIELKGEMESIAKILTLNPESLQNNVFDILIKHYLEGGTRHDQIKEEILESKVEGIETIQKEYSKREPKKQKA